MGLLSTKCFCTNADYSLTLTSSNPIYRGLSLIEGELQINIRRKIRIEKEIRIDLIGQLIEHQKSSSFSSNEKQIFFTYSSPLVTSHQNGTARTLKKRQMKYPFRIPLGINLPPSCQLKDFDIVYYLEIYHDGHFNTEYSSNYSSHTTITTDPSAFALSNNR